MTKNKLKILFCQTQFKLGGQQKVLLTIAEELGKRHDVTIYYENHNFFDLSKFKLIRPKKIHQIFNLIISVFKYIFSLNMNKKLIADDWHLRNIIKTIRQDEYDFVILLNPYILFVDEIRKLTRAKKVICWTHNIFENYVDSCFKDEKERLFSSMKSADQIVSLERYTASKWLEYNPNVTIIHNPITIGTSNKFADLESKKISFVGRIQMDMKGLDYLVQVAKLLSPDLTIHIAGSGSIEEERKFKKVIADNKVSKKIICHGALKGEDLVKHYQDSFAFISTSRFEGFPLVVVEAMSFGLPFIGFDIPALREVTDDGKFGILVTLGDVNKMADTLNNLSSSAVDKQSLSEQSFSRVKAFELKKIGLQWDKKIFEVDVE